MVENRIWFINKNNFENNNFDLQKWKKDSEDMLALLEEAYKAAQKMTLHDDADLKYAAYKKRWEGIDSTAKDWVAKFESMVGVWKKQTETVEKVS